MSEPIFSIIMPSYLGQYRGCASNRVQKFIRAVESCLAQTFSGWELIIVSDGCTQTTELYKALYSQHSNIRCIQIPKQSTWSGVMRNYGIMAATGRYITYLDTDDELGPEHLQIIHAGITPYDWVWYDDYIYNHKRQLRLNNCTLRYGRCGTSNVTHKRQLNVWWADNTYRHDWVFIQGLMQLPNHTKITTPKYYICHQPGVVDV